MGGSEVPPRKAFRKASAQTMFAASFSHLDDAEAAEILECVRRRAKAWQMGTAGLVGLVTAALVITDLTTSIHIFDHESRRLLAILLGLAEVSAVSSVFYFLRAAHGPSWLETRATTIEKQDRERDLRRARGSSWDLRRGQIVLGFAIALFLALVIATWVMDPIPSVH